MIVAKGMGRPGGLIVTFGYGRTVIGVIFQNVKTFVLNITQMCGISLER